jgi:hypothetical protein
MREFSLKQKVPYDSMEFYSINPEYYKQVHEEFMFRELIKPAKVRRKHLKPIKWEK